MTSLATQLVRGEKQSVCFPVVHAENAVIVAEGEMGHDGVFRAYAVGFPPCESRSELPPTAQVCVFYRESHLFYPTKRQLVFLACLYYTCTGCLQRGQCINEVRAVLE
jgi:hypothetical protein